MSVGVDVTEDQYLLVRDQCMKHGSHGFATATTGSCGGGDNVVKWSSRVRALFIGVL